MESEKIQARIGVGASAISWFDEWYGYPNATGDADRELWQDPRIGIGDDDREFEGLRCLSDESSDGGEGDVPGGGVGVEDPDPD